MEYLVLSTCNYRPVLIYSPYADTKVLFAIASLLHSEDSLPVAMIQKGGATLNPLHGTLISSCSKINRPTAEDPSVYETVSTFVWPDLSVRHEGLYRLRFHVYEVEDGDVILRGVDISNTLRVYAAKEFPGMADSTPFTELLKNHGLRVRVAKSSRAKRKILHQSTRGESSMHHEEQSIYNSMDSEYGGYDIDLSTRDSTPEEEDPQESMVNRSFLFANDQDVDDMPGMVPPGNVLPVPLHSSPLMSNHHGNRFPENQQTQSLFQSSHPGIHPSLTYLIAQLLPAIIHRLPLKTPGTLLGTCLRPLRFICRIAQVSNNPRLGSLYRRARPCLVPNAAMVWNIQTTPSFRLRTTNRAIRAENVGDYYYVIPRSKGYLH
jgi:hypothetical protein